VQLTGETIKSKTDFKFSIIYQCFLGIRSSFKTAKDAVQKLTTFFKNIVFEKLESQFTIIKYADIVN